MSYLGRYQLGDLLPLQLVSKSASEITAAPDDAPRVDLFSPANSKVLSLDMPIMDTSYYVFGLNVPLNSTFSVGYWRAVYRYKASGAVRLQVDYFEVVDGGDTDGTIVSMYPWARPEANYMILHTDAGKVFQGRNPSIASSGGVF